MGTRPWEEAGSTFVGVNRHTYYLMPMYLVAQVGWYRLKGVSLFSMRLFSLLYEQCKLPFASARARQSPHEPHANSGGSRTSRAVT